jgi:hypothetical protein
MDSRLALVEADEDELITRDDYFAHENKLTKLQG